MHSQIVNYQTRQGRPAKGRLLNRGFFLHQVPRLVLRCTLLGHRPVVDGYNSMPSTAAYLGRRMRWVACDWCGDRPDPRGSLDPQRWNIGDKYTGGFTNLLKPAELWQVKDREHYLPGPWNDTDKARGGLGAQLIIGRQELGFGFELKVGNGGSEHTTAADFYAGWAGALLLHTTGGHGRWLQRRLNPDSRDGSSSPSRIIRLAVTRGRLQWRLWTPRDLLRSESGLPWWRDGEISLRILDKVLGRRLYERTPVPGGRVARFVRMPESEYLVDLKLHAATSGRARGRTKKMPYEVDWSALGKGIPTEGPLRGRIVGSSVLVSDQSVAAGTWAAEATAAIAADIARSRTTHEWEPTGRVKVGAA